MINLREQVELDLEFSLEGEWGLPAVLIGPDGEKQDSPIVVRADDLSFVASDKSVNSTATDFRYIRISDGDTISINGTALNDGSYTVQNITQNKIIVVESIVDESAGATVAMVNDSLELVGQIIYDTLVDNPETGQEIIVHKPVVTLRRTSLVRIPADGEKWYCEIPIEPKVDAPKYPFIVERPTEDGGAIGFIRLYLVEAAQS